MQHSVPIVLAVRLFLVSAAAPQPSDNDQLTTLYEADQADRSGEIDWDRVHRRDSLRLEQVREMLKAGDVRRMDTTKVGDEERRQLGVRTLEEIRERLRMKNDMDEASLAPAPIQVKVQ